MICKSVHSMYSMWDQSRRVSTSIDNYVYQNEPSLHSISPISNRSQGNGLSLGESERYPRGVWGAS